MAKESVFCLLVPASVSLPLGGGGLGLIGLIEVCVLTLFTLPAWRMLPARGQRVTFCTDHIHNYYHHCFSSNRAEHHVLVRYMPAAKWTAFSVNSQEGEKRSSLKLKQRLKFIILIILAILVRLAIFSVFSSDCVINFRMEMTFVRFGCFSWFL